MHVIGLSTLSTWRRRVMAVVALGAVVRIISLITKWDEPLQLNDSVWYSEMAIDITEGRWFRAMVGTGPTAEHPPMTSLVVTPLSYLPDPLVGQRITTTLIGIFGVAMIMVAARRLCSERVAVLSGVLAALYPNIWLSDGLVMSESLAILLVATFLALSARWIHDPRPRLAAAIGVVAGVGALARSELLLLGPLAAVLVLRRHRWSGSWRPLAVAAATGLLTLSPWFAFNASRFERTVLLSNNDGTTLLGANCEDVYGGSNIGGWSLFCVLYGPEPAGDESVRSAARSAEAASYVRRNVDRVPAVMVARVLRLVDLYGIDDMVNGDVGEQRPRAAVWTGIVMMWALIPLAAIGLWRTPRAARHVLLIPVVIVILTTVLFYGGHRLRAPAEPVLCIAAAVALGRWLPERNRDHSSDPLHTVDGERTVDGAH